MIKELIGNWGHSSTSTLLHRFIGGSGWSLVGSALTQLITLFTMLFLVRLLGKEDYGKFVVVQTTLNMIGVFAGFGIGITATRYVSALKFNDVPRLVRILALNERAVLGFGLVGALLLFGSASEMASIVLNSPSLGPVLAVASWAVVFAALDGYQKSVLIGFEEMRAFAFASVIGVLIAAPLMLVLTSRLGLFGAAWGLISSTLVQASISWCQVRKVLSAAGIRMDYRGACGEWRVLRDFSLPALLAGVVVVPAHWSCQVFLANTPSGYVHIALLGIAMQWFNAIMFLPAVAGRVILPMLTEAVAVGNHSDARRLLAIATFANVGVTLPIALGIVLLSPWIIKMYGQEFDQGIVVLTVTSLSATIAAIVSVFGHLLAARSRMWLGMSMNFGWACIFVSGAFLLREHGALGVVSAMGAAYLLHAGWSTRWAYIQLYDERDKH